MSAANSLVWFVYVAIPKYKAVKQKICFVSFFEIAYFLWENLHFLR